MIAHATTLRADFSERGWSAENLLTLQEILSNAHGCAVFDFDNSLICRDIGEATLAELARRKGDPAIVDQYLALLAQAERSETPAQSRHFTQSAYNFAAQILSGQTVQQACELTSLAYANGMAESELSQLISPTASADSRFLRPFVFPEMIKLCAQLLDRNVSCYIVSASNVWSVRWMVINAINVKLAEIGAEGRLNPENVIGISTRVRHGERYYSDRELLQNSAYAQLDPAFLNQLSISDQLTPPIPSFDGKATVVHELIDPHPFLVVGDSVNDLPMLQMAENRIWLNKSGKPVEGRLLSDLRAGLDQGTLIVQTTRTKEQPGFYPI